MARRGLVCRALVKQRCETVFCKSLCLAVLRAIPLVQTYPGFQINLLSDQLSSPLGFPWTV